MRYVRRPPKGRRSAGFTVPQEADAADVSMLLRRRGFTWVAALMDWQRGLRLAHRSAVEPGDPAL